jgi:DNA polymerase-3 subunit delta
LKLYGTLNIVEIWGYPLPKNIANQRAKIANTFTIEQFSMMLSYLLNLELELKSSKISNANAYLQASLRKFSVDIR